MTHCEHCKNIIEKGTAQTVTRQDEDSITVYAVCPHCGEESIFRSVDTFDAVLEERKLIIDVVDLDNWDDIEEELGKAKDNMGKQYHHFWRKRVKSQIV